MQSSATNVSPDRQVRLEMALCKRSRELGCLYNLLTVFEAPDLDLAEVLQGVVENIATGWQFAERACTRLTLESQAWHSANFRETPWLLSEPIVLHGQPAGKLEVGYLEALPQADEGPFLVEERVLLEVVAGRLSRFIERRRMNIEFQRERDFARNLLETAQVIVLVLDTQRRIVFFNPFLEKLSGFPLAQVRGLDWFETFRPPGYRDGGKTTFLDALTRDETTSYLGPMVDRHGMIHQVEWSVRPFKDQIKEVSGLLCTGQDVTERLKVEHERKRLTTAVEQAVECIIITDSEGMIHYVNSAFELLTGYTRGEALGRNASLLNSGRQNAGFYAAMWAKLKAGRNWKGRLANRKKNGDIYEVECVISPVRDPEGNITSYIAHQRDITKEKQIQEHIRQSQKMEAIGTLAGGIAHDFNNILGGISGYVELASMSLEDQNRAAEYLEQALKAGGRAKDLVRQILTFSRQAEQQKKPLALASEVKEALRLMRASLPSTIEISQDLDAPPATVLADPTQIQQVVLNLCTNAAHAMRQRGGHLDVSLHLVHIDGREIDNYPGLSAGPHLHLCVRDTGHGMPQDVVERIFEPFFTTKAQSEGTGLGLAVVHGIVSSCQGIIKVYSQPGKGTVFHVLLPCQEYGVAAEDHQVQDIPGGHERILVVDDEEILVEIQRKLLESLGYQVSAFVCSAEALKHFQENPGQFDLVLTDLTMPNLTGLDLARALLALAPDLPVILCTGFSEASALETARSLGVREVILKPVLRGDLARAVRRHLDACTRDSSDQEGGQS